VVEIKKNIGMNKNFVNNLFKGILIMFSIAMVKKRITKILLIFSSKGIKNNIKQQQMISLYLSHNFPKP
jgi:hypothetical protein